MGVAVIPALCCCVLLYPAAPVNQEKEGRHQSKTVLLHAHGVLLTT